MQNIKNKNANNFCSWAMNTCNINEGLLAIATAGNTFFLYQLGINIEFPPLGTSLNQLYDIHYIFRMFLPYTNVLRCNVNLTASRNPDVEIPDAEIPDVEIPDVEIPDVEIPDVEIPDVENPDVEIPDHFLIYTLHEEYLPVFILKPKLEPNLYTLTEEIYFIPNDSIGTSSKYRN